MNFRGERRLNETHASTTDPEARLMRQKGKESKLSYQGHVLMENRHGLVVDARLTQADGYAEREAALEMLGELPSGRSRDAGRRPRLRHPGLRRGLSGARRDAARGAEHDEPGAAGSTAGRRGMRATRQSQRARKRIEEVFGWMKTVGLTAQDASSWTQEGRLGVHLHRGGLQPGAAERLGVRPRMKRRAVEVEGLKRTEARSGGGGTRSLEGERERVASSECEYAAKCSRNPAGARVCRTRSGSSSPDRAPAGRSTPFFRSLLETTRNLR